ncbi:HupE/UreJ family protein [Comamonas endophytica]|uniref:HupE/UreJ family protein n=1 Tax=Comamonas endophytica TaxID=2949090 RepID=A0ABY6G8E8_9BURK|nr:MULTISPECIES: HupE/UreJ family protein [unclassified Acidovorax]MCD2511477.1 HupE/UreJ family protein [Acidovorax sp. D4N7]UYG50867.1 HupE/UreJ family protein [Acidovorax sp. 5MLIR]
MQIKPLIAAAGAALAALPFAALAHPAADGAHTHGFFDTALHAMAHPFTGADHLAAMVAVGAWSAVTVRPAWRAPAAFVALLVAGALAGFAGLALPGVEPMIAASVLVLGLLLALQKKMPWGAAATLAGVFAFFHGAAHGYELAGDTGLAAVGALAGMAVGSAVLHVAGMLLGRAVLQRHRLLTALAGAGTAALGAFMLTRLA